MNRNYCAREECGVRRAQIGDQIRHLFGLAHSAHRISARNKLSPRGLLISMLFPDFLKQLSLNTGHRYRIDSDIMFGELGRRAARERLQPSFRRGVVRAADAARSRSA